MGRYKVLYFFARLYILSNFLEGATRLLYHLVAGVKSWIVPLLQTGVEESKPGAFKTSEGKCMTFWSMLTLLIFQPVCLVQILCSNCHFIWDHSQLGLRSGCFLESGLVSFRFCMFGWAFKGCDSSIYTHMLRSDQRPVLRLKHRFFFLCDCI